MTTFLPGLSQEEFFSEYWRKKPLFMKGGALHLIDLKLDYAEADDIAERVASHSPDRVAHNPGKISFIRGAHVHDDRLKAVVKDVQAKWNIPEANIDISRTFGAGSIGCHFDYNDNFVLQQEGYKIWRISRPTMLTSDDKRRRIIEEPGFPGNIYLDEDFQEFKLEAGDLLYLPMFFPHWGTSDGPSLSISLACVPRNGLSELLPLLRDVLSEDEQWWKPIDHSDISTNRLAHMLDALADPQLRRRLFDMWTNKRHIAVSQAPEPEKATEPMATEKLTINVDIAPLKPLFGAAAPMDLAESILPTPENPLPAALNDMVAKRYLKRILRLARDRAKTCEDPRLAKSIQTLMDHIVSLPHHALLLWSRRPELTSWVWQTEREFQAGYQRKPDSLLLHLASFTIGELLIARQSIDNELLCLPSRPGELDILNLARRISLPWTNVKAFSIRTTVDGLELKNDDQTIHVPLDSLLGDTQHPLVSNIPRVTANGPIALTQHAWYDQYYPQSSIAPEQLGDHELTEFCDAIGDGFKVINKYWTEAGTLIRDSIQQMMPLADHGNDPWNFSIHGFRGLILASPRRSYLAAQTLCHETAHNRFSSIVDLFPIAKNPDDVVWSPFVQAERPLINLFHGIFAFLNDIHMTIRCAPHFDSNHGPAIPPYYDITHSRLTEALELVKKNTQPSVHGEQLIAGFEKLMP